MAAALPVRSAVSHVALQAYQIALVAPKAFTSVVQPVLLVQVTVPAAHLSLHVLN